MNEPETTNIEASREQETDRRAEGLLQDLLDDKDIKLPAGMIIEYLPKGWRWTSPDPPSCMHCKNGQHDGWKIDCRIANMMGMRAEPLRRAFHCKDYEEGEYRGKEVYGLYCQGHSSEEIANILSIPEERLVRCFGDNEFACGILTSLLQYEFFDEEPITDDDKRDEILNLIKKEFGEKWFTDYELDMSWVSRYVRWVRDYWERTDKTEWVKKGLLQAKDGRYRLGS